MQSSNPLKAAAWMLGAAASFAMMAVAGRAIQVEMNTFELMLYRSFIGFAAVVAFLVLRGKGFASVHSARPWLHVKRNLFHFTGQNLWFYAVMLIPLGQLAALEFTNPIWVALLAPLLLGERLTRTRLLAVLAGFAGIVVVAQPGSAPIGIGHVTALAAAVGFALNTIYTRQIMSYDSVICVLFWMTLSQGVMSLVLSLPGGIPAPTVATAPWLLIIGLTGISAHYALTSALNHAPASVVAPMEYFRLPVMAALGVTLYNEPLSGMVFVGAALIISGNLINLRVETRRVPA